MSPRLRAIALGILVVLAFDILHAIFHQSEVFVRGENLVTDTFFKVRPLPKSSNEVIVLAIDNDAYKQIGPMPWPRMNYARIAQALRYIGARGIVYDIRFTGPSKFNQPIPGQGDVPATEVWRFDGTDAMLSEPLLTDQFAVVGGDKKVYAVRLSNGRRSWEAKVGGQVRKSPVAVNNFIVAASNDGNLYFIDSKNGKVAGTFAAGSPITTDVYADGGAVFFGCGGNKIFCVDSKGFTKKWELEVGGAVRGMSEISSGNFFCGCEDGKLYCIAVDGKNVWEFEVGKPVSTPTVSGGRVIAGADDGKVYCVREDKPEKIWEFETGGPVQLKPACAYGLVFAASVDKTLYAIDSSTVKLAWSFTSPLKINEITCPPTVAEGFVFVGFSRGETDNTFYILQAKTGIKFADVESAGRIEGSPAVKDNFVYYGTGDRKVYCMRAYPTVVDPLGNDDGAFADFLSSVPCLISYEYNLSMYEGNLANLKLYEDAIAALEPVIVSHLRDGTEFLLEDSDLPPLPDYIQKDFGEDIKYQALKNVLQREILEKLPEKDHMQAIHNAAKILLPAPSSLQLGRFRKSAMSALAEFYLPLHGQAVANGENVSPMRKYVESSFHYFGKTTQMTAQVNIMPERDGVSRRVRIFVPHEGKYFAHQGLAAWLLRERSFGRNYTFEVRDSSLFIHGSSGTIEVPFEEDFKVSLNWNGNASEPTKAFDPLPVGLVYQLWKMRYAKLAPAMVPGLAKTHPLRKMLSDKSGALTPDVPRITTDDALIDETLTGYLKTIDEDEKEKRRNLQSMDDAARSDAEKTLAQYSEFRQQYADYKVLLEDLRAKIRDKVCFIGDESSGSQDIYATPINPLMKGVYLGSNLCDMLGSNRFMHKPKYAFISFLFIFIAGAIIAISSGTLQPGLSITVGIGALVLTFFTSYFIFLSGVVLPFATSIAGQVVCFLSVTAYREATEFRQRRIEEQKRKLLQDEFSKNTSPELVEAIIKDPEAIKKHQPYECTIMFSDIKGFTTISESMSADELGPFMNQYHDAITSEILKHKAFIDKYIGDAVMALYGCPIRYEDHAIRACTAALEAKKALEVFNKGMDEKGKPKCFTRIGINTGRVIGGMYGSSAKQNFTVIGDAVNVASRLEGLNKYYHTQIMVGPLTRKQAGDNFVFRHIDIVRVAGKAEPVEIFELVGFPNEVDERRKKVFSLYEEAHLLYCQGYFDMAIEVIENAQDIKDLVDSDEFCMSLVQKCKKYREAIPENFQGITDYTTK